MEKIWIAYEVEEDGALCFGDILFYIRKTANKKIQFTSQDLEHVYMCLDLDEHNLINKRGAYMFFNILMSTHEHLKFELTQKMLP